MESRTIRDLRIRNRGRVLHSLLLAGESTRATLAHDCDLSVATIANVVTDLIAEGLVEEIGSMPSNGGRPISRLAPRGVGAYVIGADVGEQGVTVELFDFALRRIDRVFDKMPNRTTDPSAIATALGAAVDRIRSDHEYIADHLVGIGLGLPGIVDTTPEGTTTVYAQSLGWDPVGLRNLYADASVPILADNGAKTMATAEAWRGGARGVQHCVVALVGQGLGASLIVDGTLLRGRSSSAGEWGHTKIVMGGRKCACGGRGCLEAYVGGSAIMQRWSEAGGAPNSSAEDALALLIASADRGDEVANRVLDETLELLGTGLANLVNLFNPEKIIIGGWAGLALAGARLPHITRHVRSQALHRPGEQVSIEASELGEDAVALGAALLPLLQLVRGTIQSPGFAEDSRQTQGP